MRRSVLAATCLVAVTLFAAPAAAQPGMTEPVPLPAPPPVAVPEDTVSENTALALSLGGAIAPWVLILGASTSTDGGNDTLATVGAIGTFFGPSLGHWYAHDFATRGLGLRALGVGATVAGAMVALSECPLFSEEECNESGAATVLLIAGVGLYIGGTVDDVVTAPRKARAYNQRNMMVVPVVHQHSGGVAVVGQF